MKRALLIFSGILGLLAVAATFTVLIVDMVEIPTTDTTQSTTQTTESGKDIASSLHTSQYKNNNETTTTTGAKTTTAAKTTTTTKERTWFTAYTGSVTLPSKHTTSTRGENTTKVAGKTTRTLTQSEKDMVYGIVYNKMLKEYNDKLIEQQNRQKQITSLKNEIAGLQGQASDLYVQYQNNLKQLKTKCDAMGMSTNSGYYKAQKESLEAQYKNGLAPISEKIDKLQKQVKDAEAALETIKEPTKDEIWQAYLYELEMYQLNTLS